MLGIEQAVVSDKPTDKERLEQLREALNGAFRSLGRDECGTCRLLGSRGHIYRDDRGEGGDGWLLYVRCRSGRHWTYTKRALAFCRLTQDGDDEGCLRLDRLPSAAEAEEIRQAVGLRQTKPPPQIRPGFGPRRPIFSL
jgi:hypothetical protein